MSSLETRRYYSDEEFEHGLRCAECKRLFVEGDEYRERLDNPPFIDTEIGEAFCVTLVCVSCDEAGLQAFIEDWRCPVYGVPDA